MKYALVYLLKGKAERYHQSLIKIGPKYGENYLIENPLPSHVTLKSPFELKKIGELEKILHNFSTTHMQTRIRIKGFGHFNREVIFLRVDFTKQAQKIQRDLLESIKNLPGMGFHEFDKKHSPHATLAYCSGERSFCEMWRYLMMLDEPKFNLNFDNIAILKKPRKYWAIHKIYKLK